jgi:hypothetical protein
MSDNQTLLDMIEDLQIELVALRAERQQWRNIADKMYAEIVKDYCWHCGHEMTRNCYTSDLMDIYRDACITSGVRHD